MTREIKHLDLCSEQQNPPPYKVRGGKRINISKNVRGKVVVRDPSDITGIGIHQTACVFGPTGASRALQRHRRALKVPCHALAFRDGTFVTAFPLEWYVYHGNELNAFSLGLEIEGHYPGLPDDPRTPAREDIRTTWRGKATPFDDLIVETSREALRYLVEEGRSRGMPIEWIWAHRQTNGSKPSDPGWEIWKHVVLDYGVPKLGLRTQPDQTWRDGKPIPAQWEPGANGRY